MVLICFFLRPNGAMHNNPPQRGGEQVLATSPCKGNGTYRRFSQKHCPFRAILSGGSFPTALR
ncbi:MAG: hypothetical protein LBE12_11745 [Planctomycetaceae bacterium]|nr:hypothetical protein [Planctomycetaceae bacterium]